MPVQQVENYRIIESATEISIYQKLKTSLHPPFSKSANADASDATTAAGTL